MEGQMGHARRENSIKIDCFNTLSKSFKGTALRNRKSFYLNLHFYLKYYSPIERRGIIRVWRRLCDVPMCLTVNLLVVKNLHALN